jgi:galactofuranose transport system ATP-binding protein
MLQAVSITKRFPGTLALDAVDFRARAGEVHALLGENGAGKSTLIKVLTGVYPRDGGVVRLAGQEIRPRSPLDAQRLGIATVYQEVNLIPGLSLAENIYLGRFPRRWGRLGGIDRGAMRRGAREAFARLALELDVSRPVGSYPVALQQMCAIARALSLDARVLILDEPTSSLDRQEVERLFEALRRLKAQGLAIVFVTHFLDQVYAISDRITVLRNGRQVGEAQAAELPRLELVARMIGRDAAEVRQLAEAGARSGQARGGTPLVTARRLGRRGAVGPLDLAIHAGEVVGLAGLLGSGRTETARLLFGADRADSGQVAVQDRPLRLSSPRPAIRAGFGFCPEDRKTSGILPELSVRENIALVVQTQRGWWRPLSRRRQRQLASEYIAALRIATPDTEKPIRLLSGGNQQKTILARWLAAQPRFLMLDEPTRGIDVGAKAEIAQLIARLRDGGLAVLFISSEIEETARICDRVIVLRDRRKVGELAGDAVSEPAIMACIATGTAVEEPAT